MPLFNNLKIGISLLPFDISNVGCLCQNPQKTPQIHVQWTRDWFWFYRSLSDRLVFGRISRSPYQQSITAYFTYTCLAKSHAYVFMNCCDRRGLMHLLSCCDIPPPHTHTHRVKAVHTTMYCYTAQCTCNMSCNFTPRSESIKSQSRVHIMQVFVYMASVQCWMWELGVFMMVMMINGDISIYSNDTLCPLFLNGDISIYSNDTLCPLFLFQREKKREFFPKRMFKVISKPANN